MSRYKSKLVTLLDEVESQAPEFYEVNGYERKYAIEGQPRGIATSSILSVMVYQ